MVKVFIRFKGGSERSFKCYLIKKHIETFHIHPSTESFSREESETVLGAFE